MFPVLLAEEDCSIKRGQPSITRDLPKPSSFLAEVFLIIYHYCYGVVGNVSPVRQRQHFICLMSLFQGHVASSNFTLTGP